MLNPFDVAPSIQKLRPSHNLGGLWDIVTGIYTVGKHGQSLLASGALPVFSMAGPGNSFKTTQLVSAILTVMERQFDVAQMMVYDTEVSFTYARVNQVCKYMPKMGAMDHTRDDLTATERRVLITSKVEMQGDKYFDMVKSIIDSRLKNKDRGKLTTPFLTSLGKNLTEYPPLFVLMDSLSEMGTSTQDKKFTDNEIGSSDNNMQWMGQGRAKKDLITQFPRLSAQGNVFFSMTAHVGDKFDMGGMFNPGPQTLTHSKKGSKITGTTKAFEFINNILWEIQHVKPLLHKESRSALYPATESDKAKGNMDLNLVRCVATRNKQGPTGVQIENVVSQREGLLPHLSMFHYIKENLADKGWGIGGSSQHMYLELCPEITFSRVTIRNMLEGKNANPVLQRAVEHTARMLQIKQHWAELQSDLMCTPAELYRDLKELGYNWDDLLHNTRNWWTYIECEGKMSERELNEMDLMRMRKELYRPYWLKKAS